MTEDLDVLRAVLLAAAEAPPNRQPEPPALEGVSDDAIMEHQARLIDDGMLTGKKVPDYTGVRAYQVIIVTGITRQGLALAKSIRDNERWQKVKASALVLGGAASAKLLAVVAEKLGERLLN